MNTSTVELTTNALMVIGNVAEKRRIWRLLGRYEMILSSVFWYSTERSLSAYNEQYIKQKFHRPMYIHAFKLM